MTDTPTAYSMTYSWGVPPTPSVREIIARMEDIADGLKRSGVMNLGMSLSKQIDELRKILGAVE